MEKGMEMVRVKFLVEMPPYLVGEEGEVAQSIIDLYPDHVEVIKTKEKAKKVVEETAEKEVEKAPNKMQKKASTK